jgi:nickel-dependent lactate racemase
MHIKLAYGKTGLVVRLDERWNVCVIEPEYIPALADIPAAIRESLRTPIASPSLREMASQGKQIGIIFNDITRPTPNNLILKGILEELKDRQDASITLFNALGTHRPNTDAELQGMLGRDITDRFRIVQNNAFDPATQVSLGKTTRGHEIWINCELAQCDLKILTGFIEPHFFAGFSGGGKAIMPGMGGLATILQNHGAGMIAHPNATWGVTRGNPIWDEVHEVASKLDSLFLFNVTLNRDKHITGVFAGELSAAHAAGCEQVRRTAMTPVDEPCDIVVTTNSGYPLDLNLYQAVKGMSAASRIVRQGGAIIIAAECWDGIPEHGLYGQILHKANDPQDMLNNILSATEPIQDQWQAQIQAQIQLKADVYLYSDHLSSEQVQSAHLKKISSIEETLKMLVGRFGKETRIAVLPEGPQSLPYLSR